MFGESRIQASGSFYEILSVCRRRVCMIKKYVVKDFERPRQDILKKYQNLDVSTVYEAQGKKGLMNNGLKPNLQEKYICGPRSEEHTSELQSRFDLVCRLLLEKKKSKVQVVLQELNNGRQMNKPLVLIEV